MGKNQIADDLIEANQTIEKLSLDLERLTEVSHVKERLILASYREKDKLCTQFMAVLDELREAKAYTDNIIKSMINGLMVLEPDATIRTVNQGACDLLGYQAEELIGQPVVKILGQEERKLFEKIGLEMIAKRGMANVERAAITKEGNTIPVFLSASIMHNFDDNIQGVVCVVHDLTERKQAEEALQKARDELEMRVQQRTADLAKINQALEAEVIEHKRTAEELRKYKENLEQIVQERTSALEEAQKELINKAMEAGRAQLSAMVLHNIGNAITPINVQVEEMRLEELGRICHYFENCYTDLYKHAQDLHQYVQNNPRGIEVFAFMGNLVEALKAFTTQQAANVNKIVQTVSYISEILALQQAYAARNHETKEHTDLNKLIEDSIRMQKDALKKRGITLKTDLDQSQPKLVIDKNRLMQVLINLIMNSYDAIDELDDHSAKKVINIKTFSNKGTVGFKVTDSGIGIEPDSIDTLFEFGKSNKGSSGFGLYYCKIFVEANKGVFKLRSPGRDQGATAEVRFEV